jgi:phosphomannomutase
MLDTLMSRLRKGPPADLGGVPVARVDDLAQGSPLLPPTDGMRYFLQDQSRVIVRPSGTEPKLKVYLEAIVAVRESTGLVAARTQAADRLIRMGASMRSLTMLG